MNPKSTAAFAAAPARPFNPRASHRLVCYKAGRLSRSETQTFVKRPHTRSARSERPQSARKGTVTMVMTKSTMLPLGTKAPDFNLLEPLTGKKVSLSEVTGEKGTLVVFMCNHCPFVVLLKDQLKALGADFQELGISMVGISSNDVEGYPQDGVDAMAAMAKKQFSTFPYLYDETQEVAKAYRAACTPDVFLFDKDLSLVYRGRVDEATPGNGKPVNGASIRKAADLLVKGEPIPTDNMVPSIGCNIKWKDGNWPDY